MQDVAQWLKHGTYDEGVKLYEEYGSNTFLKTKFKAGESPYNAAKLRELLSELVGCESQEPGAKNQEVGAVNKPADEPKTPSADEAKKYLQLCKQRDRYYLELNALMANRHALPDGEDLKQCAFAILSTHQKVQECWAQIDYYQQHGHFPVPDAPPERAAIDPKKEMQLLRQTISKAKTRLKSPTCRDRAQTQKLLDDAQAKLAVLVRERKGAKG